MSEIWYPTSFEEQNLAGDIRITVDDIADYSYPPGRRKRYTTDGWRKAVAIGILHEQEFMAEGELTRLRLVEAAARVVIEESDELSKRGHEESAAVRALRASLEGK